MADYTGHNIREAIIALSQGPRDPDPPKSFTITPSAALSRRVALLADKLGQSWNHTALVLLDASVDDALDVVDNEVTAKVTRSGLTPEQVEDFEILPAPEQAEVENAMARHYADHPSEPFTDPLLREGQFRDE